MYEMKITFGKDKQTAMTREEMTGSGELLFRAILTKREIECITYFWTLSFTHWIAH